MYKFDKEIIEPGPDTIIWRYMSYSKFVTLLEKQSLFFSASDKLGDSFEGAIPLNQSACIEALEITMGTPKESIDYLAAQRKKLRFLSLVNCWHMNNSESFAMWKIYVVDEGIAIQTTYQRLKDSFSKYTNDIFMGKVDYYLKNTSILCDTAIHTLFHKRAVFKNENEVRCITHGTMIKEDKSNEAEFDERLSNGGEYVPVDVSMLIDKIILAPASKIWFSSLLQSTMKKYSIDKIIEKSILDGNPYF